MKLEFIPLFWTVFLLLGVVLPMLRADSPPPRLWLVGDSTVRVGTPGQRGWGEEISRYFDPAAIEVDNRAIGGRSSRTFRTEGRWAAIMEELRPGDVVLIQFGHNDGGPINDDSRARGTLPGTGDETEAIDNLLTGQPEVVHTYGWYLRHYIREAKATGAVPVICSPVPRKIWENGRIARDRYAGWARAVAMEEGALFLDLNDRIGRRYEALGTEAVEAFFADERTHTNEAGARFNAEAVVLGLLDLQPNPVAGTLSKAGQALQ
ncbi:MAG: rhamnogalacturonan acetylesterase [Puniceicoccaceae bacterium]|nr:MAG: rhamnogalacturonan acetylesterase [Puniceicoccaceae bacterium]